MRIASALTIGLIFGLGITFSGMANPAKVLNFFDIFGNWDPSLAFVMGGALAVTIPGYRMVLGRPAPVLEPRFQLPDTRVINRRLVLGSATFGIGWGIAGFCPGGALPAVGTLHPGVLLFLAALVVGILLARMLQSGHLARSKA
ncbi:MAG: YeeE/YedE family protein [Tabrizicola sp.]|nr:YeeE/YedE family protein [Tabrizicola sp.]HMS96317.1 YeeE/YedE family protein [Tabrizicola sp.]